jgi:hypothetical protein
MDLPSWERVRKGVDSPENNMVQDGTHGGSTLTPLMKPERVRY